MKPILFNTEMVCGLLAGTKTVTRRVVKPQPRGHAALLTSNLLPETTEAGVGAVYAFEDGTVTSPPYRPSDILYVRETFTPCCMNEISRKGHSDFCYKASYTSPVYGCIDLAAPQVCKWHPSIHMPREAARIFLRVTDVRAERLQSITELDILEKEGVTVDFPHPKPSYMSLAYTETRLKPAVRKAFADLWDSTIKPKGRSICVWEANPWVWVIEFERCEKPEGD